MLDTLDCRLFSFLIKVGQQNAQSVSWQQLPREAQSSCITETFERGGQDDCSTRSPHTNVEKGSLAAKTRLGWWAVGLSATFVVVFIINQALFMSGALRWERMILPLLYAIAPLGCGLAGGVVGLIAVIRQHERSWLVWLT